jgi:hypothetical protein
MLKLEIVGKWDSTIVEDLALTKVIDITTGTWILSHLKTCILCPMLVSPAIVIDYTFIYIYIFFLIVNSRSGLDSLPRTNGEIPARMESASHTAS